MNEVVRVSSVVSTSERLEYPGVANHKIPAGSYKVGVELKSPRKIRNHSLHKSTFLNISFMK